MKHGFWNTTTRRSARYIELSGRGNFEDFIRRTGEQSNTRTFVSSPRAFGVTFHPADVARLVAQHRLTGVVGFGDSE